MGEYREEKNMALNTRDKDGNIADYLETRRPFGAEVKKEWCRVWPCKTKASTRALNFI